MFELDTPCLIRYEHYNLMLKPAAIDFFFDVIWI